MTSSLKVVTTFPFTTESQQILKEAAATEAMIVTTDDELSAHLPDAEVVCSYFMPYDWRTLAPKLRWLQFPGAGVDSLAPTGLLDANSGVIVTTAAGIHAETISEYVLGSMLMFNWNWPLMVRLQDEHKWARSASWYHLGGRELAGQTLGIIGLGHIGRRIAQLGHAFGMQVLGTRRSIHTSKEQESEVDQSFLPEQLHELLPLCDYVVISVPLTRETEKLIGEAELRMMRSNTYLVNIARGRVIDEQALVRALREGWIAGAGLDVTEEEPLPPESPLYSMPNVILTPHISGNSVHYDTRLAALFADNLKRYRSGQELLNQYEPSRGY
ncbi:MAG TPA: D-2-hydroxyacid dehydrogenase [Ktedonobacteraceae bacterium]|nr:D-2-hydroxyacid dehydrogenase [Ktedonobacteraceae bacterium]